MFIGEKNINAPQNKMHTSGKKNKKQKNYQVWKKLNNIIHKEEKSVNTNRYRSDRDDRICRQLFNFIPLSVMFKKVEQRGMIDPISRYVCYKK